MMDYAKQMEAQRRAFEAQFGSLEEMGFEDKTKAVEESESDADGVSDSNDENENASDEDEDEFHEDMIDRVDDEQSDSDYEEETAIQTPQPTVIKFRDTTREYTGVSKEDQKLLKSGKATIKKKAPITTNTPKTKEDTEDLKNDLELQRFLSESNILQQHQKYSGADLLSTTLEGTGTDSLVGKVRRHALKSRIDGLSEQTSHGKNRSKLEKMPMSMRKGMVESYKKKVAKFEQEAKDGGIILAKVSKGQLRDIGKKVTIHERIGKLDKSKLKSQYRKKGLKINSVGRNTRNGLIISQKDIDRINGTGQTKGKKHGKRR